MYPASFLLGAVVAPFKMLLSTMKTSKEHQHEYSKVKQKQQQQQKTNKGQRNKKQTQKKAKQATDSNKVEI